MDSKMNRRAWIKKGIFVIPTVSIFVPTLIRGQASMLKNSSYLASLKAQAAGGGGGGGFAEVAGVKASGGNNNLVDSGAVAFSNNVTAGQLLIAAGAWWAAAAAPTTVTNTDNLGSSWTTVLGDVPSGLTWRTWIAYAVAAGSGACTVTSNPGVGVAHSGSFSVDAFTGQNGTPADVNGGRSEGSGTTASDAITTGVANALIIAVASQDGGTMALGASAPATLLGENETNSSNQCHIVSFQIATTVTAYTMSFTLGSSTAWACQTHSFAPA